MVSSDYINFVRPKLATKRSSNMKSVFVNSRGYKLTRQSIWLLTKEIVNSTKIKSFSHGEYNNNRSKDLPNSISL